MKSALPALAAAILLSAAGVGEAQVRNRWTLQYEQDKPRLYTHRDALDKLDNYWYFTYTLTNNNEEVVPLLIDVMMYVPTGRDLQNDAGKLDSEGIKAERKDRAKAESLMFGKFYSNVLQPEDIEFAVITKHSKIGNRSPGIVRESIEEFKRGFVEDPPAEHAGRWKKGDRWYLNASELRRIRHIQPGQKLMGIAIFKGVDMHARRLEVQISGLYDIFRIDKYSEEEIKLSYENRVLKKIYDFPGDEFERERDILYERGSEWVVKSIGPIASKETLGALIDSLLAMLKKEEEWEKAKVPAEDRDKARAKENISPLDMSVSGRVVQMATGVDFKFDPSKTLLENQGAVWRIHEWWVKHKAKLAFNGVTGRFDVKDDPLPGEVREPKEK